MQKIFDPVLDDGTLPPDDIPPLARGALLSDNLNVRFGVVRGYLPSHRFTAEQVTHLRTVITTLAGDLHDPAAVEALLVLLEVFYILDVSEYYLDKIFGARPLRYLRTWGDLVPPQRRPQRLTRAWVWVPNQYQPRLCPVGEDGALHIYSDQAPSAR